MHHVYLFIKTLIIEILLVKISKNTKNTKVKIT